MQQAEQNAWEALASQEYHSFARWCAAWQALNSVQPQQQDDPFLPAVRIARTAVLGRHYVDGWHCRECGARLEGRSCATCGTTRRGSTPAEGPEFDCRYCHGKGSVKEGLTSLTVPHGARRRLIANIPARICSLCGDFSISSGTMTLMETAVQKETKPNGLVTMPWYDLQQLDRDTQGLADR